MLYHHHQFGSLYQTYTEQAYKKMKPVPVLSHLACLVLVPMYGGLKLTEVKRPGQGTSDPAILCLQ